MQYKVLNFLEFGLGQTNILEPRRCMLMFFRIFGIAWICRTCQTRLTCRTSRTSLTCPTSLILVAICGSGSEHLLLDAALLKELLLLPIDESFKHISGLVNQSNAKITVLFGV